MEVSAQLAAAVEALWAEQRLHQQQQQQQQQQQVQQGQDQALEEEGDDWPPPPIIADNQMMMMMEEQQQQPAGLVPPPAAASAAAAAAVAAGVGPPAGAGVPPMPVLFYPSSTSSPNSQQVSMVQQDVRMELTNEELRWAWNIKKAMLSQQSGDRLDKISDYDIVQIALIVRGNVEAALERIGNMQAYREQYSIRDTYDDSRQSIMKLIKIVPGLFLSLSYNHRDGNYVMVYDLAGCDWNNQVTSSHHNQMMVCSGLYYLFHALTPDFEAIRKGTILLAECDGFDWRKHIHLAAFRKFWCELGINYPIDYQKIKYFNSGIFINMINSLKKKFLPRHIVNKIETGCFLEDGRLSDIYAVPSLDACNQRLIDRIDESLRRRYNHIHSFTLPPLPPQQSPSSQPQQPQQG